VYQFANPAGITHDAAGNLYVADSANDRVQVYSTTVPKPTGDNRRPVVTIGSPTNGTVVPGGVTFVNGTVTDTAPFGVAKVEVSVQDTDTGLWWNSKNATWTTTQAWGAAALSGPTITSMSYSFAFVGARYDGHYTATVRAVDISSIASATTPSVSFTTAGSPGDVLPPTPTLTAPAMDASVPSGPVTIQGNAGDNVGVTQAQLSIRDRATNRWFDPATGTFVNGPQIWFATSLGTPGGVETTWSYVFTQASAGSGSYYATARASDAAGNQSTTMPFTRFTVSGPPDTTAPDTTIAVPTSGQSCGLGTVSMSGSASDNVGVSAVHVAIQDTGSGQWWSGSGWTASQQWLSATLFSPGAATTGWSYAWPAPSSGSYVVTARATDTASLVDPEPASAPFTVLAQDVTPPDATVAVPASNQAFPLGPVTFSGVATDDLGVANVQVAIRNRVTLRWWNGSSWSASFVWLNGATLDAPGATSTGWSFAWTPSAGGSYAVTVRAVDGSGNTDPTRPWVNFSVTT
jgi:hypothetical protein